MANGKLAPLIKENYPQYYSWNVYPKNDCITIHKVNEEWGVLGNFAPIPLTVKGITFDSSEKLFQIMKFKDKDVIQTIYAKKGLPLKWSAKSYEKEGYRREDWGKIIIDCMKFCLQTKYNQNKDFRNTLNSTKGRYIVEDQTNIKTTKSGKIKSADTWGVVLDREKYVGSNLLGRLLMELRDNGKLEYTLPSDIFDFTQFLKEK